MHRRDVLRAAGASAALLWLGCGRGARVAPPVVPVRYDRSQLRARLRAAVERLHHVFVDASALAAVRTHVAAATDAGGRGERRSVVASLVLVARDADGATFESATSALSPAAIDAAVAELVGGRTGSARNVDFGKPINVRRKLAADPRGIADGAWLTQARALAARAEGFGSSRLVYRGAYIEVDDADVLFVAPGRDLYERRVRARTGVVLAAWRGHRLRSDAAEIAAVGGIDPAAISDDDIAAAAARALELTTPGPPPRGVTQVVLDPSVVAAIVEAGVAGAMTAPSWQRWGAAALRGRALGSEAVTIVDDPTAATVGGYAFDDEGRAGARAMLIERGVVVAPLADAAGAAAIGLPATSHARRPGLIGPIAARPSHLAVAPGEAGRDDLVAGVDDGLLLEGADEVHVDLRSWRAVVRVARGRRLRAGARTGHVYPDMELRAELPALLRSIAAASHEVARFARRDDIDGEPLWRATTAPWWLAHAEVASRGGDA